MNSKAITNKVLILKLNILMKKKMSIFLQAVHQIKMETKNQRTKYLN